MCKQKCFKIRYVKLKFQANLSDKHLKSILIIGFSSLKPQFSDILGKKKKKKKKKKTFQFLFTLFFFVLFF